MTSQRRQLYIDASISPGGGGVTPDGRKTPYVDWDYYLKRLRGELADEGHLVLDPYRESRWRVQCLLRDGFGWQGEKDPPEYIEKQLRELARDMTYIPELRVHNVVILGDHDDCHIPHPSSD